LNIERMNMEEPKRLLGVMRVPFLILAPACALVGVGTAAWTGATINALHLILALVGAITAHISVNVLNEYFDFESGLDMKTRRTPFSGGSGTLPENPEMARSALNLGLVAAAITALIGVYFLFNLRLALLPLGILGLVVILSYTKWITRYPLICLVAPGLGFGTFMVMGTDFVLSGSYTWTAFIASLVPFFLVNDLLLLNQLPDAEADETVGRRHLPIVSGKRTSSIVYDVFLLAAYLSIVVGVVLRLLPAASLLGLITLIIAIPLARGAYRYAEDMEQLMPFLAKNVLVNIATPILLAAGLLLDTWLRG
jgi:1,4-dihydroxy-2-naphthoate octaprenyltransferase